MITLLHTDPRHADFIALVRLLDEALAVIDGEDTAFYSQFNKTDSLQHAVVAYENGLPVGCGAIKLFDAGTVEVKRMYVLPEHRRKGIAALLLDALEQRARETGYTRCVLETGKRMPSAIALYERAGYMRMDNYGQYVGVENSLCFQKKL